MIKLVIKLVIVALLANAAWRVGNAYLSFYRFKDAVTQASQFEPGRRRRGLRQKVLELAEQYDVPLTDDDFTVTRDEHRTRIKGSFKEGIQLVPACPYPWPFSSTWTRSIRCSCCRRSGNAYAPRAASAASRVALALSRQAAPPPLSPSSA